MARSSRLNMGRLQNDNGEKPAPVGDRRSRAETRRAIRRRDQLSAYPHLHGHHASCQGPSPQCPPQLVRHIQGDLRQCARARQERLEMR